VRGAVFCDGARASRNQTLLAWGHERAVCTAYKLERAVRMLGRCFVAIVALASFVSLGAVLRILARFSRPTSCG
jgi:hypothetical protein